jgi:hypothetical protein
MQQALTPRKLRDYVSRSREMTVYVEYRDSGSMYIETVIYFQGSYEPWSRTDDVSDLNRLIDWANKLGIDVVDTDTEGDP